MFFYIILLYIPMSNWLDLSNVSNTLKSSYVKGFVDVSGGDIIARNGNFLLAGDASLNSNLFVAGDLSINQRLHVDGDVTITGNLKADKISNEYIINSETTNYTLIVAEDDPWKDAFQQMDTSGVAQVRILPATGAEKFAEYIYNKLNNFVLTETDGRVKVTKVKFAEHGKNTAYYSE